MISMYYDTQKPRLLDLCCAAGGAAMGYYRAGFEVIGVDIEPQPGYPFEMYAMDALEFLQHPENLIGFDAIHASPPCQRYMRSGNVDRDKHPDLLGPMRDALNATGLPWVIENVPGAPMRADVLLCGSMFGLEVRRHRWFEFSDGMTRFPPFSCDHTRPITGVYGNAHGAGGAAPGMLPGDQETWSRAMGINWMTTRELALAIPPAFTEWIGAQLLDVLSVSGKGE